MKSVKGIKHRSSSMSAEQCKKVLNHTTGPLKLIEHCTLIILHFKKERISAKKKNTKVPGWLSESGV